MTNRGPNAALFDDGAASEPALSSATAHLLLRAAMHNTINAAIHGDSENCLKL